MKKHLFLRGLAVFLCLSMVMGLVPGGIFADLLKVNAVSEEMVEVDLNGSFETLDAEGKPVNWRVNMGDEGAFKINTEDVAAGNNAIQITAQGKSNYLQSALIPAKEGDTYELTLKAKVLSNANSVYAGLWFSPDNTYSFVDNYCAKAVSITATEWTEYKVEWTYYPGAANMWIEFGNNSGSQADYLVDDVVLKINGVVVTTGLVQAPEEEAPSEVDLDLNWSFENVDENGAPTAWNVPEEGATINTTDKLAGNNALQIDAVAAAKTVQSYAIPVADAGDQYEVTVNVKRLSGTDPIYMGIWFGAEPHKNYDNNCCNAVNAAADNEWHEYTVAWPVYKDASYMWVEIGNYSGATVSYLIDDITLKINGEVVETIKVAAPEEPVETEPVETEPVETEPVAPDVTGYEEVINEQFAVEEGDENFSTDWTASDEWAANKYDVYVGGPYYEEGISVFLQGWKGIEDGWIQSPAFEVNAGLDVVALANTFGAEGCANMMLIFVDAEGNVLDTATKAIGTADWTEEFIEATAPAGAVSAYLKFQRATADIGIDNVRVYVEQPTPIFSDGFETDLTNQWTASHSHVMVWIPDPGYDPYEGRTVLLMQDYGTDVGHTITSNDIFVVPGETYTLTYQVMDHWAYVGSSIGSEVKLIFVDASGNEVGSVVKPVASEEGANVAAWTEKTVVAVAPADAAAVRIVFNSVVEKKDVIYLVDALALYGVEGTEPEEPEETNPEIVIPNAPTTDYKAPAIENFPGEHPYVFFTAEELAALKAVKDNADPSIYGFSWKSQVDSIIAGAEAALNLTQINQGSNAGTSVIFDVYPVLVDPNDPSMDEKYLEASIIDGKLVEYPHLGFGCLIPDSLRPHMENLALAYALTGEAKYAERAIFFAESMSNWEWWGDYYWLTTYAPSAKADACVAWTMQGVAAVYDLCYDAMTEEQRETIATAIYEKGITFLAAGYNKNSTQNGNMMLLGGLLTGLASIISEDNYDELKPYIDIAVEGVKLSFDNYYYSGNTEGHYYTDFGLNYFMPGVTHFCRATGIETLNEHPVLTEMFPYWTVYWAAPGSNLHPIYGDGGGSSYMHTTMACISKLNGDPLANYYLVSAGGTASAFKNLMYLNPNPEIAEPTDKVAFVPQIGYGALRTGFADDDMLLALFSNQSKMGHNHYDQNSFQLAVNGAWIVTDTGGGSYYSDDRTIGTSLIHNTILVDGKGQTVKSTGAMEKIFGSDLYGYIVGSAAGAYGTNTLDKFDRHAIQLNHAEKAYYIIIDDLASAEEHKFSWQMYNGGTTGLEVDGEVLPELTTVKGNNASIVVGVNKLNLSFIAKDGVDMAKQIYEDNGIFVADTFIASSAATKTHQFMTVLSTEGIMGRDYVNFGVMANGSYAQTEYTLENGVSYKSSNTSGKVILKPNAIGTISTMFFRGGAVGDWIKVPFEVEEDGVYDLTAIMGVSDGCCTTKVTVDDIAVSEPHDLSGLPETTYNYEFEALELTAGTHYLTYEVTDIGHSESYAGPTWFLINVGGLILDRVDVETEEVETRPDTVVVKETYDDENVLGALLNYAEGLDDLVIFNRGDAMITAGALSTDGKQASVLGLAGDVITEGFAATNATTLVYGETVLFEAEKALNIVADAEGWHVDTAEAQTIKLNAELGDVIVTVNGEAVEVTVEDGMIVVALEAGASDIALVEAEVEDPTDPSEPADPTDPSEPADPTDPSEPADPTDPSEPDDGGNSGTGDVAPIAAMIALTALVVTGMALIVTKRKFF